MLKKARQGKAVDEDDLPPRIAIAPVSKPQSAPTKQPSPAPIFEPTITHEDPKPTPAPRKPAPATPQPSSTASPTSGNC